MTQNNPTSADTDTDPSRKHGDIRTSRTIRFSDPEWEKVEEAASRRGGSPAEFVRNAALAAAADNTGTVPGVLPPGFLELIKRIYLGSYMLSTLKREEMIHEGRGEELDRTVQAARDIQDFLLDGTSK